MIKSIPAADIKVGTFVLRPRVPEWRKVTRVTRRGTVVYVQYGTSAESIYKADKMVTEHTP